MMPLLAALLHDEAVDIIYFWASILMVALPITLFSVLTYFAVKGARKKEPGVGSEEPAAPTSMIPR